MSADDGDSTRFRLSAATSGATVDVCLRAAGDRWIASADAAGTATAGIGATARDALRAALSRFDPRTVVALLADPVLFGASADVLRIARPASAHADGR